MRVAALIGVLSVLVAIVLAQNDESASFDQSDGPRALATIRAVVTTPPEADPETNRDRERRTATGSTLAPVSTLPVRSAEPASGVGDGVQPLRLVVPSLELDVGIVSVGVDDEGLFDVPRADQVGWYRYGAAPGQEGSAVLAAHVDYNGQVGAFFALQDVEEGDLMHVEFTDGSTQSFEVVHQTLYEKQALPADELFRRGGDPVLRLATCGGRFDPVSRSYLGNRVVSAVPVETSR